MRDELDSHSEQLRQLKADNTNLIKNVRIRMAALKENFPDANAKDDWKRAHNEKDITSTERDS